ncbi:hypothetical protein EYC84_004193 [Monilinia fructicola]|uniref:F-box domain-containing protein n=1 Tax=Monilinia fructicola TaxID=38448 RepID=A0A5M9JZJ3_MONFR|nr:hypothetical protein EYC84_004193 [Monilinia fructicola]
MAKMDELPSEIILNITSYLEPADIVKLQFVSKRYLELARDDTLWREQCFTHSSFLDKLRRRQELISTESEDDSGMRDLAIALATNNGTGDSRLHRARHEARDPKARLNERIRILANWDPSYPTENVKWYDEYIARNAPISTNWLQQPRNRESPSYEHLEVRGWLYIHREVKRVPRWWLHRLMMVPFVSGTSVRMRLEKNVSALTVLLREPYIAVQSGLVEVDLETLQTVNHERYPFSITALSEAKHPVPLTVGTNLSLYLHDSRQRANVGPLNHAEQLDSFSVPSDSANKPFGLKSFLNPEPSSDILNYDRRNFPKLRGTIHSGARLSQIATLPYPFASMDKDLARRGELSIEQVWQAKTRPGKTLIACGEYNTKGSLEMYGLAPDSNLSNISSQFTAGRLQDSTMKNRQNIFQLETLICCQSWDGFTEVRRWNIAHGSDAAPRGIFGTLGDSYMDSGSGDIAIKIQPTDSGLDERPVNENDLVLWTGEKLGLLNFSGKPGFTADSFEETAKTAEEALLDQEERTHAETMRRALEMQANEVSILSRILTIKLEIREVVRGVNGPYILAAQQLNGHCTYGLSSIFRPFDMVRRYLPAQQGIRDAPCDTGTSFQDHISIDSILPSSRVVWGPPAGAAYPPSKFLWNYWHVSLQNTEYSNSRSSIYLACEVLEDSGPVETFWDEDHVSYIFSGHFRMV